MKNKKIGMAVVLTVVTVVSIFGFSGIAVSEWNEAAHQKALEKSDMYIQRKDVALKKTYTPAGINDSNLNHEKSKSKTLSYKQTMVLSKGQQLDVYVDKEDIEYRYNQEGKLQSICNRAALFEENEYGPISEEQAIGIAREEGAFLYGNEFEDFSLEACKKKDTGSYDVSFSIRYGEGGYILGPTISFTITESGELFGSVNRNSQHYNDFDVRLLNTFKNSDVEASIKQQVREKHGDMLKTFSIVGIQLMYDYEGGKYILSNTVNIERTDYVDVEVYYYDFPQ